MIGAARGAFGALRAAPPSSDVGFGALERDDEDDEDDEDDKDDGGDEDDEDDEDDADDEDEDDGGVCCAFMPRTTATRARGSHNTPNRDRARFTVNS